MPAPRRPARRAALLGLVLAAAALSAPLMAQTRLRVEPEVVVFDDGGRTRRETISIWVDNIPPPGLGSFLFFIESRVRQLLGQDPCLVIESGRLDPGLRAAWNNEVVSNFIPLPSLTSANWQAFANRQGNLPLPKGTIRLGEITFLGQEHNCPTPLQDEFFLGNPDPLRPDPLAFWGSGAVPQTLFDELHGAAWAWNAVPDIDFTVTCPRTFPPPPDPFVDGDLLFLECQVSNLGSLRAPQGPIMVVVFSGDEIIDDNDHLIARSVATGRIGGHSTVSIDIAERPVRTTPGTVNICTRIDVVEFGVDQGWGVMLETDETNNVECQPLTVIEPLRDLIVTPGSLSVDPDPRDASGLLRAGLNLKVSYEEFNQGIGAVRANHSNRVLLSDDPATVLTDPSASICKMTVGGATGLPLLGGTSINLTYGLGSGSSTEICKIPFRLPPGPYDLYVDLDSSGNISEKDPNGASAPAEANNLASIPVTVAPPPDPRFRIQHRGSAPTDQRVEIFGPARGNFLVVVASASGLTSYSLELTWSPPELLSLGDPSLPGGDPNQISFRNFLETMGLAQSCAVTDLDPAGGRVGVACTTSDPNGSGAAAWTEFGAPLIDVTVTPLLPGNGSLSLSNIAATDAQGQPFTALTALGGTFVINGVPELAIRNPVPAPAVWPGEPFSVGFDVVNDGFGKATPPVRTDLIISRDAVHDPTNSASPDLLACTLNESASLPGKTTASRQLDGCLIDENLRPGLYTGFWQLRSNLDPNRRSTAIIPLPSRVLSLRTDGDDQSLEMRPHPVTPGGSAGGALTSTRRFSAGSVASVRSEARNLNWFVRLHRPGKGPGVLSVQEIPLEDGQKNETLRELRVPRTVHKVLAGADIDGDGEDELILLQRFTRSGDSLDFRRMDFRLEFPSVCPSAAVTPVFRERIVAAAGIQMDADSEDEIAVVTRDGVLTIYDVLLSGPVLPAKPCILKATPSVIQPHGTAELIPLAADTGFSLPEGRHGTDRGARRRDGRGATGSSVPGNRPGSGRGTRPGTEGAAALLGAPGDRLRSLCALDYGLDGVEEIGGLFDIGGGIQAFRIFDPPVSMGGSSLLLADDDGFGGTDGHGRILAISCTR